MKPISFPLPLFGLTVRIEAAPAPRRAASASHPPLSVLKPPSPGAFSRRLLQDVGFDDASGGRLLQDIGLDDSRRD